VNADTLTVQALLNCLVREVSAPEGLVREADGHLLVRLARSGRLLRLGTRRPSAGLGPRLAGDAALRCPDGWHPVGWERLAGLIADELTLATGAPNDEFAGQVRASYTAMTAIAAARQPGAAATGDPVIDCYLPSEQALIAGHRFHPAPKARDGAPRAWLPFAPEAGARFPLRFLAVRADALDAEGDSSGLDRLGGPAVPPGYRALPAHPWQLMLLAKAPWLRQAFRDQVLIDLGDGTREAVPTSSVRTVYDPEADLFCKFSLNVRITNCVRKNAWYELAGAVAMTGFLGPVFADLAARFPGTALLGEPGYRTVALPGEAAVEGLSVILREGLRGYLAPGATPVLAAALTEPPADQGYQAGQAPLANPASSLLDGRDPDWLLAWWEAYVRAVAPPVLHALFGHGVVLEPHQQNVVIGVDGDGRPAQAIFRDLEGAKLLIPEHDDFLATLKPGVARALGYDAERGWNRVAYCLFVNHLAEVAAAVADRQPHRADRIEAALWQRAGTVLTGFARDHGWPPALRALLAGAPLPAKANLRLRWARGADRGAGYLPVRNPFADPVADPGAAAPATGGLSGTRFRAGCPAGRAAAPC
jgi:siderophore synthetase component